MENNIETNCKNTIEYLQERARMFSTIEFNHTEFYNLEKNEPEKAITFVAEFSKGHKKKTYLSVLLEKFPNTPLNQRGTPYMICCPVALGFDDKCIHNCEKCWLTEVK
jgi:hypothetical protein